MLTRAWVLATAVAVLMGLGTGAAGAEEEGGSAAEEELARTYAPVMMLVEQAEKCGPGEPYVPSDVDALFGESSIALRGPWATRDLVTVAPTVEELAEGLEGYALDQPGDPLKPGCDYEEWAASVWGTDPPPTIYAHVATQSGVEDRLALQYFFYYPFNDYNNKHESDWERIQVEFATADLEEALATGPERVLYAQHYGAEQSSWDDEKLTLDGTHPVVYVSAGSHASQYDAGLYIGRSADEGFGCDTTVGPHTEVRPDVRTIPSDPAAAAAAFPWTTYRGHWGEIGPQRFYEGPTGPNMKQAWTKPFTWSAKARDHSFSLPGAEVAGNEAAEYFCSLVATGSDAFRRFSSHPAPTLLALFAALLALGWVVRRSGWSEASPHPVVTARRPGQVVAAALQMLTRHRKIFLLVAAPAAAASIASSALTAATPPVSAWWWSALSGVVLLVLGLALAWAQLATSQAVVDLDADRPVTLGSLLRSTRARAPAVLVTLALWALLVGSLTITGLLAPVALVLAIAWSLVLPIVQLEGILGWAALRRSWRLVRHQVRTVLLVLAVSVVLVTTLGGVLAALAFVVLPAPFGVISAIPALVTTLVWPVTALLTTYAWANGRALEEVRSTAADRVAVS